MLIRFWTANANFGTGPFKDAEHIRHLLATTPPSQPVVMGLQEVKNLRRPWPVRRVVARARRLLAAARQIRTPEPSVFQDTTTPSTAGTALVSWGVRVRNTRLWKLGAFKGTLTRWTSIGRVRDVVTQSVHIPPKRSGRAAQDAAIRRVKRRTDRARRQGREWVVAGDFNRDIEEVARRLGGVAYGEGIVGLICSPGLEVTDWGVDHYGENHDLTDHPAVWIDAVA